MISLLITGMIKKIINDKKKCLPWLYSIIFLLCTFTLGACLKDDVFGLSTFNDIKAFELPGQTGSTTINKDERRIEVPMSENANLENLTPVNIELSNFATLTPAANISMDFSQEVEYTVTAEDGSMAIWTVAAKAALPTPQLANSNFDAWYTQSSYQEPGESKETTVWGTANRAMAIAGDPNTTPEDLGNGDLAARLVSVEAPLLVRMAAATLFTGKFTEGFPSVTDPRSNIDFGTPFSGRPKSFKVEYKYIPGLSYEDANGNVIPGSDECDIYVLLERRDGSSVERIGTGWYRSGDEHTDFTNIEVSIKYGELTSADPEYSYANIRDNEAWGDPEATPTHITVVFSSSALGDYFTGAIGSELWVNNFELVY